MTTLSIFCNPIEGRSKKGTSNFKLREYNALPEEGRIEKLVDSSHKYLQFYTKWQFLVGL
jgi:hypothetical protein